MFERNARRTEENLPTEVQALFRSYGESLPDFDASPDFMPKLWERIESQRTVTYSFRRLTSAFVTASAAVCMLCAVALWTPPSQTTNNRNSNTYVEVLADDASPSDDGGVDSTAL